MASSLEDLLAEEGFKARRSLTKPRVSFRSNSACSPLDPSQGRHNLEYAASDCIKKAVRPTSTASKHGSNGQASKSEGTKCEVQRDKRNRRDKVDERSKREYRERLEERGHNDVLEGRRVSVTLSHDKKRNENAEVVEEENKNFKDIYSNEVHAPEGEKGTISRKSGEEEGYKEDLRNGINADKRYSNSLKKHLLGSLSFGHNNRKSLKVPEIFHDRSDTGSRNSKNREDSYSQNRDDISHGVSIPSLDEVAVQAIVSILSRHVKRFLKDGNYRTLLHRSCFSSLNFTGTEGHTGSKVIANLEQAIGIIEKFAEESAKEKDLKRASLQLSMITSLNTNSLKDSVTSGIPNSKLSACAHLYLGLIYKLQKKDRGSAKHTLQVFCDSPFEARTMLLPELWDHLFLPHLSHLEAWFDHEADSMGDLPSRPKKIELLQKAYNEILDSATYQFAVYYKDWLTEGDESPAMPSIPIPFVSFHDVHQGSFTGHSTGLTSPDDPFSPQPMVSKKLYDAVFGNSRKPGVEGAEDDEDVENLDNCMRSSDGSYDLKHTVTHFSDMVNHNDQDTEEDSIESAPDDASLPGNGVTLTNGWKIRDVNFPSEVEDDVENDSNYSTMFQETTREFQTLHMQSNVEVNKITIKSIAKSILQSQHSLDSVDFTGSTTNSSEGSISKASANHTKVQSSSEEISESYENFEERSFLLSIPQDFLCPLTGKLLDDPVTLETGQTFERQAIKAWFEKGNRACPVTGKNLDCPAVPDTNFVLKRIIHNWKSDRCKHLLAFASRMIDNSREAMSKDKDEMVILVVEQLLTTFGKEEGTKNAKQLVSCGGLQFLLQKFELGNLEENTHILALLSSCIEAYAGCGNQVAREINKVCLVKLIHSRQVKSIDNAVLLLTKLICLNRVKDSTLLLSDFLKERMESTMHVLLQHLQSSLPEQRTLVAVLLLHLYLMIGSQQYSVHREEAVGAIIMALYGSLTDETLRGKCCEALLILGGPFSFSGKLFIDTWMQKQAKFVDRSEVNFLNNQDKDLVVEDTADDEEQASKAWLRNLAKSLLDSGKKSFLKAISTCLGSGNLDLVGLCLTTVAWLSFTLSSLSDSAFQLSAFAALISQLKDCLENSVVVEHKTLASMSLLNFSKISECRVLLMTLGKELAAPLRSISGVTWTARKLYAIISGEDT